MNEQGKPDLAVDATLLETFATALGVSITIYDRNDVLIFASQDFTRLFPVPAKVLTPGARLRDALGAIYDIGVQEGQIFSAGTNHISRDDWIAERIALHWRERYESVEQMPDGRWIRLGKRRMPNGILITFVTDITEQKKRERELVEMRDQAELAQHILDNLANPVIVKDSQLRFVIVNDAICRLLGFHAKNIIGRTATELVGADAGAIFEESERAVLETGVPFDFVEDIARADGTVVRSITRKRRSGTPGNHYVTISIDHITTSSTEAKAHGAEAGAVRRPGEGRASPQGRILVVDENRERASALVASLAAQGIDVMAVHDPREAFVFLDTAAAMGLEIDRVEPSPMMKAALGRCAASAKYPALMHLVDDAAPAELPVIGAGEEAAAPLPSRCLPEERPSPLPEPTGLPVAIPEERAASTVPACEVRAEKNEPSVMPGRRRVRVLVAEDNDVNQIVFEQILEGIGVDFRIVGDGERAVAAWRETSPDIILMDVSMPVMSGLQATQAIRAAERAVERADGAHSPHVPIIAVTAHAMSGDRDKCFAAGMDDYLTKPVSPEKLELAIRNWIDDAKLAIVAA